MIDKTVAKEAAKINSGGNLIHEFMAYAYYAYRLNFVTQAGVVIHPIELPKGKVQIALVINQDSTIKQVEKSWWEIDKWRRALEEWQGVHTSENDKFHKSMSDAQESGVSYNQIAEQINQRIVELLRKHKAWLEDKAGFEKQFGDDVHLWFYEYMKDPQHNDPASFKFADNLLSYCRPKLGKEERSTLLEDVLDRLQSGEPPFLSGGGLVQGKRDVRERINYWREKHKIVGNTS